MVQFYQLPDVPGFPGINPGIGVRLYEEKKSCRKVWVLCLHFVPETGIKEILIRNILLDVSKVLLDFSKVFN